VICGKWFFGTILFCCAILVIIAAAHTFSHNNGRSEAYGMKFKQIDVPDYYVQQVCDGSDDDDNDEKDDDDLKILCYESDIYYDCSCKCYSLSWWNGQDPQITDRFCKSDSDNY
jgi:hypothetical protein